MSVSGFLQLLLLVGVLVALAILVPRNSEVQGQLAALHLPSFLAPSPAKTAPEEPSTVERVVNSTERLAGATGGAMTNAAATMERSSAASSKALRERD